MKYNEEGTRVLEVGGPPILLEPVSLKLSMHRKGVPLVHLLDHVGRRTGETVPVKDGVIVLDGAETRTIYYEIEYSK